MKVLISKQKKKKRFKEYIQKYSVYYDIVLFDTEGNVLVKLDERTTEIKKSEDEIISRVLVGNEEYVETFKYHDFLPHKKRSLVYSSVIKDGNGKDAKNIGVLSLCFRFQDEMTSIFDNLKSEKNKECLMVLDSDGVVIASSDKYHISLGTKFNHILDDKFKLISHGGRDYLAKSCATNGYQGYFGQEWYGHIMVAVDYAFLEDENSIEIDQDILLAILQEGKGFSEELKKIPLKANSIQSNLNRLVWNGNINKAKDDRRENMRGFSRALLNEISSTGEETKKIFDHSIANLTKTMVLNNSSYIASLMVDIMDRNLYERANDCRWWALTEEFKKVLSIDNIDKKESKKLENILKYINSLYTVYTNLFIYDKNGIIIAVSNANEKYLLGKQLSLDLVTKTKELKSTNSYFVSKFEKTEFYNKDYTYIYYSAIKQNTDFLGGIGVVFDSKPEFKAMLEESIPNYNKKKNKEVFGVYTNKDKKIISSTNPELNIGDKLDLDDKFFNLINGESYSEIVIYNNNYYALGVKCSQGYREYKTVDKYSNDIYAIFFSYISSANLKINKNKKLFSETQIGLIDNPAEIASFYIGGKCLGVDVNDVYETVSIKKIDLSPTLNKEHHFKGTVIYNNKAVAVIDIKKYIDEKNTEDYKEIVIVKNYDKQSENYIGILVNSLGDIPEISKSRIKKLDKHLLGKYTLINSIVTPLENSKNDKLISILDISKLKENLVED
ncbi:MAG: chemotaxis protein CheW [Halarcobacter sp.]